MALFLTLQRVCPDLPSCPQDTMRIWMKSAQPPPFPSLWRMKILRQWTRRKRLLQPQSRGMLPWSALPLSSLVWWLSLQPLGSSSSPWALCVSCLCSLSSVLHVVFLPVSTASALGPGEVRLQMQVDAARSPDAVRVTLHPDGLQLKALQCPGSLAVVFWQPASFRWQ